MIGLFLFFFSVFLDIYFHFQAYHLPVNVMIKSFHQIIWAFWWLIIAQASFVIIIIFKILNKIFRQLAWTLLIFSFNETLSGKPTSFSDKFDSFCLCFIHFCCRKLMRSLSKFIWNFTLFPKMAQPPIFFFKCFNKLIKICKF